MTTTSGPTPPHALVRGLPDAQLRVMTQEAVAWRKSGVLVGEALRGFAQRLIVEAGLAADDVLQIADDLVVIEAATRFVNQKCAE